VLPRGIAREGPAKVSRKGAESFQAWASRRVSDDGSPQAVVPTAVWDRQLAGKVGVAMTEGQRHDGEGKANGASAEDVPADKLHAQTLGHNLQKLEALAKARSERV
jgi:hypothetical protein